MISTGFFSFRPSIALVDGGTMNMFATHRLDGITVAIGSGRSFWGGGGWIREGMDIFLF
jgi:hypothetical protein